MCAYSEGALRTVRAITPARRQDDGPAPRRAHEGAGPLHVHIYVHDQGEHVVATRTAALNQIVAVRKGVQSEVHSGISRLHHLSQKVNLLSGFIRSYRTIRDEDPALPGETHPTTKRKRTSNPNRRRSN